MESGLFTFIGATTENPSFEVNSALLSRAAVYVLQPLSSDDLKQIVALAQAQQALPAIENEATERLVAYADGDARRLLNTLETLEMAAAQEGLAEITDAWVLKVLGERMRRYDKGRAVLRHDQRTAQNRCAAPTPTPRCTGWCACSTAAPIRGIWRDAWCAWPPRILAWPTRALRLALDCAEVYERLGSP